MKNTNLLALLAVIGTSTTALAFAGCSSSSGNETASDASTSDVTTGDDGGNPDSPSGNDSSSPGNDGGTEAATPPPAPPALGTLIDRMGRPAISTALNNTFDLAESDAGPVTCLAPGLCAAKDAYNQDGNPADWNANWGAAFYFSLAIYDSLDNVCGNQAGYGAASLPAYQALAGLFAQDALWVNTNSTICNQYLGVELGALGITNGDCGGRTLTENTIDETYQLLSGQFAVVADAGAGAGVGPSATLVTNGITSASTTPSTTFPYFHPPQ
jgi:hypothetical protein